VPARARRKLYGRSCNQRDSPPPAGFAARTIGFQASDASIRREASASGTDGGSMGGLQRRELLEWRCTIELIVDPLSGYQARYFFFIASGAFSERESRQFRGGSPF